MLKTCLQCAEEFKTYHSTVIYCSKACHNRSMERRETYTCADCGCSFQRPKHVIKEEAKERFCSAACLRRHQREAAAVHVCVVCAKEFRPGNKAIRHCSKACRDAGLVTKVGMACAKCGKPFLASQNKAVNGRRFCSHKCATEWATGENHPNYLGGRARPDPSSRKWRHIRLVVLARDGACRLCGQEKSASGRNLHVHHINARRKFLLSAAANDPDNLVTLCQPCHTRVEMDLIHGRTSSLPKWLRPRA